MIIRYVFLVNCFAGRSYSSKISGAVAYVAWRLESGSTLWLSVEGGLVGGSARIVSVEAVLLSLRGTQRSL